MATDYTVSDLIADFLVRCEVETVFGIVSVHNIPMLDSISRGNRIRYVMTRGEHGAGHMADGYGRASGKLGVLFTSTGPGAANAVGGLIEARFASTPILHITGQTSTKFMERGMGTVHDIPNQRGLMAAAGKTAYTITTPGDAYAILREAVAEATSVPRGPVTVEVPIDVQRSAVARPASLDAYELPRFPPLRPSEAEMAALVEIVAGSKRPVLWLGRGAAGAGRPAEALLAMGVGMVTSWAGRGVVSEDHPQNLGALNGGGHELIEKFYETVDLMLVAGSRVRGHETQDFSARLPKRMVQIDVDPRADGRTFANAGFVNGDACLVLEELVQRLKGRFAVEPGYPEAFKRLKVDARESFKRTLGAYASFADQLAAVMPKDAIWARDITINNSTWGNKLLPLRDTTTNIYPIGAGIGQGMCLGIGAALAAKGRKTIVLIGDGGLALSLPELWTAIQEQLDITIIVANDNGYGVIRHIQDKAAGGRRRFDTLLSPDLAELAKVAGLPFWRVSKSGDFGGMVAKALAVRGPAMVEIDMRTIGEHPPYFPYAPKVPAEAPVG
ncbi:MAG: thiamine pyrophosphate-binding protein [Alphaproteobacteria bacterium]|mgnify:CR=1 FL=1